MATTALLILAQLLLLGAALQDALSLKISNLFSLALLAVFAAWVAVVGADWSLWQNLAALLLTFGVGIGLFAARWLGGGDVKLLIAASAWFSLGGWGMTVFYIGVAGLVLAVAILLVRRVAPAGGRIPVFQPKGPIPYGIAIAAGAIIGLNLIGPNPKPPAPPPAVTLPADGSGRVL